MLKFSYFDTESAWDEGLHAASQRINPQLQPFHRIASKRIFAAAVFDVSVSADGAISCEGITHWAAEKDCDERRVVRDLFHHLYARPDRAVVGFGSIATDVQLLQLAAQEYSLVLPQQFRAERPRYRGLDAPGRHFDLGLAIKNGGKTWHHLSEVLVRIGLPSFLMADKKHVRFPHDDQGWAFARHKREKGLIALQNAQLAESMEPYATPAGLKAASGRLRRELQARAKAELDFALITAGPARKRPVFIEFVKQRADLGDTDAVRVHCNLANKVTETRGRRLDRMRSTLAASLLEIKQSAAKMNAQIQSLAVPLRAAVDSLKVRAAALQAQHAQAMRKRRAADERAWSDDARVEAGQIVSARQTTQVARIAACVVLHSELYEIIREAERRRIEQEDQLARERRQASSAKAEAMAALLNRAQSDAIAREAERRRQLLEAELAREREHANRIEATRIAAEAERNARAEASNSYYDRRESLMAAVRSRDSDSQGTVEYLNAWSSSIQALPARIAITDQHLEKIEAEAVLALLRNGRGLPAVQKIVLGRSPAGNLAEITLASALDNREVRDALAVEANKFDREQTISAMYKITPKTEVDEHFVELWEKIFDERPIDPTLDREDRNRSIDFEVASVLTNDGHLLLDVARALVKHSPSVVNLSPSNRSDYAEDVLSYFAERTGLASGWAPPISAVDRMDHRAAAVAPTRASPGAPAGENISMAEALHVISRRARLMSAGNASRRHDLPGADGTRLDDRDNQAVRTEKTPLRIQPSTTLGPSL